MSEIGKYAYKVIVGEMKFKEGPIGQILLTTKGKSYFFEDEDAHEEDPEKEMTATSIRELKRKVRRRVDSMIDEHFDSNPSNPNPDTITKENRSDKNA